MFCSFGCINNFLFDKNLLKIFKRTDDVIPICGCNSLKVRFFYKILFAYYVKEIRLIFASFDRELIANTRCKDQNHEAK